MSYVNLHTNLGQDHVDPIAEYNRCLEEKSALKAAYDDQVATWRAKKAARASYEKAYAQYQLEWKRWSGAKAGAAAAYASAQASHAAALKKWQARNALYQSALAYNRSIGIANQQRREQVEKKYGVKFPSGADCISADQKRDATRICLSTIKGVGGAGLGYTFSFQQYPACALSDLNVCQPLRTVTPPGPYPPSPTPPPPAPPAPKPPTVVPEAGPKPPQPQYPTCTPPKSPKGAVTTFGLIAAVAVGGGFLGYRAWKKRKA